ncbi:uncharacterized protein V1518DRAFT_412534 [Limtongia smithiae]|uniref:uncharacterized protein n=1 Tax=Limtongia smithiae TaxID=1125753 RepID=UPI0034CD85B4
MGISSIIVSSASMRAILVIYIIGTSRSDSSVLVTMPLIAVRPISLIHRLRRLSTKSRRNCQLNISNTLSPVLGSR